MTYFLLTDQEYYKKWSSFFQDLINEILGSYSSNKDKEKDEIAKLLQQKVKIVMIPKEVLKNSIVLCGSKCVVTLYTSEGRSGDSPTLEIKRDSIIKNLFLNDMKKIVRNSRNS